MLLQKGGEELLEEYNSEEAKKRKLLREKKWKKKDGAWKRMVNTTEHVEEAEDKKPAAVQRVEPNEVNVEEAEDKKPAAEQRATRPQRTKLQGQIISTQETILVAEKAGKNNQVLDENQSLQWGGTGTSAQNEVLWLQKSHHHLLHQG